MTAPPTEGKLFDFSESGRLKEEGMDRAARNRSKRLIIAREIAARLGRFRGLVTSDDVGRVLKKEHGIASLGPGAGSIFKTSDWEYTGEFKKSARVTNHSRLVRVWRYVGREQG